MTGLSGRSASRARGSGGKCPVAPHSCATARFAQAVRTIRQCVALGLAAQLCSYARGPDDKLSRCDLPRAAGTDRSFRALPQPGPHSCCSGSTENPGESFQSQWVHPCGRSARRPLQAMRTRPPGLSAMPCGLLLLGSASASRRRSTERNAGAHRLLLNCGRGTTQLLGGRLGGSRLGKLLQSTQFAGTPRCSVVGWTFGHQSLLEITVERRRDHTQPAARTDSGVWVDLSELHQSLGMFGSGWTEFGAGWAWLDPG